MTTAVASRRISTGVAWGAFGVLAWAAISVFTGGGSAHAEEAPSNPLDSLTSVVSSTVSGATSLVAPVITEVVAPVVQAVVAPVQSTLPAVVDTVAETVTSVPVVGPAVAPIVTAAADTASATTTPVTDVLQNAPASQLTDPVLDAVTGLPLVGSLLEKLGVLDALDNVVGALDATTSVVGDVAEGTVPPVLDALHPVTPTAPPGSEDPGAAVPEESETPGADAGAVTDSPPAIEVPEADVVSPVRGPELPVLSGGSAASTTLVDAADTFPTPVSSPTNAQPGAAAPTSSAGHGGGSSSDGARLSDAAAESLRAWKRTLGASDDALPSSPVAETDISPD